MRVLESLLSTAMLRRASCGIRGGDVRGGPDRLGGELGRRCPTPHETRVEAEADWEHNVPLHSDLTHSMLSY